MDASAGTTSQWFEGNLARVLGTRATALPALAAGAGRKADPALALFRQNLGQRFQRVVDPVSGNVSFETNGAAFLPLEDEEDVDSRIADLARTYVGAARAALAGIDSSVCLPGRCPGEAEDSLGPIRAAIERLAADAGRRGSRVQTLIAIDELNNVDHGLLIDLQAKYREAYAASRTVALERGLDAIELALDALKAFEDAFQDHYSGGEESLADFAEVVRRCATRIPGQVRDVYRVIEQAGVSRCELAHVTINVRGITLGGTEHKSFDLPEVLRVLETVPLGWSDMAERGTRPAIGAIRTGAERLLQIVAGMQQAKLDKVFPLDAYTSGELERTLKRLIGLATTVFGELLRRHPYPLPAPPVPPNPRKGMSDTTAL